MIKINSRLAAMLLLGFSSGLPLALTGSTLQAWFTSAGVDLLTIGALTLVGLPYVWKFLWAPFLDYFIPPWLGRRRGWILLTQICLCVALFFLAHFHPNEAPKLIGLVALIIAFLSATQDIAIDAYRADILLEEERGLGAAYFIFSYRIAMIASGGLALILAQYLGWQHLYELMATLIGCTAITTYFIANPKQPAQLPKNLVDAIYKPFQDLFKRENITLILLFVILYKIGDAFALTLMSNFLLKGIGFSLAEVGLAFKTMGLFATILGAFFAGILLIRMNIFNALLWFASAQAASNLLFMLLAYAGKNYFIFVSSIFIESLCSGMSTAALMAFLMSLCHPSYSATQYALLSALSSLGRVLLGPLAAIMVQHVGWIYFYFWSFFLCFPGILLIGLLRNRVRLQCAS